jgi:hypothetical protein
MTKYLKEEICRCRDHANEFVKYITDQEFSKKIESIYEVNMAHVEIEENMNVYLACAILWKCIFESDYSVIIFSKQSYLIMDAIKVVLDTIPSFLKMPCNILRNNHIELINGSSIRLISNVIGTRGSAANLLAIVNPQDISHPEMKELEESLFPVMHSMKNGRIFSVKGN